MTIALVAAAALCAVEGFYLIKYSRPEIRYFQVFKDRPANFADQNKSPEPTETTKKNTENTDPEWLKQYPQLQFLYDKGDRAVDVTETNPKGPIFALRKPSGNTWLGDYSLWFVDPLSHEKMLANGIINNCSGVEIINDSENYVVLKVKKSPCEAGVSTDVYYYAKEDGSLAYTLSYNSGYAEGASSFISGKSGIDSFDAYLNFKGSCETPTKYDEDAGHAPILELTGISVKTDKITKTFALTEKKRVFCEMQYGGGFDFPGINHASVDGDVIRFSATNILSFGVNLKKIFSTPSFAVTAAVWPKDKPDAAFVATLPENVREQIPRSQVPMFAFDVTGLRQMLMEPYNGWTVLSGAIDDNQKAYSFYLKGTITTDQPMGKDSGELVRGSKATIGEYNGGYEASWKEGEVLYSLEVRCTNNSAICQTEEKIKELLRHIIYIGGSYQ